jgi:hypothetical protein
MQLHGLWRWFKQNVAAGMGWGATSTAMSVALVVTALPILCVMVRDVGIGKVIAAMVATPAAGHVRGVLPRLRQLFYADAL